LIECEELNHHDRVPDFDDLEEMKLILLFSMPLGVSLPHLNKRDEDCRHNSMFQAKKLIIKDESCFELHLSIQSNHICQYSRWLE
jgi:hypothetical protein